jgi:hypothetical protein
MDCVLNIAVPEIVLNDAGVYALIGEGTATKLQLVTSPPDKGTGRNKTEVLSSINCYSILQS